MHEPLCESVQIGRSWRQPNDLNAFAHENAAECVRVFLPIRPDAWQKYNRDRVVGICIALRTRWPRATVLTYSRQAIYRRRKVRAQECLAMLTPGSGIVNVARRVALM